MNKTLKLCLKNWSVDNIFLPCECAYKIGRIIIKKQEEDWVMEMQHQRRFETLIVDINYYWKPRLVIIHNCIIKEHFGRFYAYECEFGLLNRRLMKKRSIFLEMSRKITETLGRDIHFDWELLEDEEEYNKVRDILRSY